MGKCSLNIHTIDVTEIYVIDERNDKNDRIENIIKYKWYNTKNTWTFFLKIGSTWTQN